MVNFIVLKDMVLERTEMGRVTKYTEKKIKLKWKMGWGIASIINETEDKLYRIIFQEAALSLQYVVPVRV